ncbi:hypothetical protein AB0F88_29330 [Streptosporangium sp. NPDC023963]|uniref:hypothetical protein n=1 Tax=Streptosporangium sp. NPDC023963 TaxID=3155608 RepID=UPI0034468055
MQDVGGLLQANLLQANGFGRLHRDDLTAGEVVSAGRQVTAENAGLAGNELEEAATLWTRDGRGIKLQILTSVTNSLSVSRMEQRTLGAGVRAGAVGLGCAGMSGAEMVRKGHVRGIGPSGVGAEAPAPLAPPDSERTGGRR